MDGDLTLKCSTFSRRDILTGFDNKITTSDVSTSICITLIHTPGFVMLAVYNSGDLIDRIPLQPRLDEIVITASQSSLNITDNNTVEFNLTLDPSADPAEFLDKIYELKSLLFSLCLTLSNSSNSGCRNARYCLPNPGEMTGSDWPSSHRRFWKITRLIGPLTEP